MGRSGNYGDIFKLSETKIMKIIKPNGENENRIQNELLQKDIFSLIFYYCEELKRSKILIPELYKVSTHNMQIILYQEYIKGVNISSLLNHESRFGDYLDTVKYLKTIFTYIFQLNKTNPKFRIDTNLENFIINSNQEMYLVDIYPPISDDIFNSNLLLNKQILELYIDLEIQIIALISYWFKPLIMNNIDNKQIYINLYNTILELLYECNLGFSFIDVKKRKGSIFVKKLLLIEAYINSIIKFNVLRRKFSELSITKLIRG